MRNYTFGQIRKAAVAVVSFVLVVLATALGVGPEVIPPEALPYVNIALAVGGAYGVYRVPNDDEPDKDGPPLRGNTVEPSNVKVIE